MKIIRQLFTAIVVAILAWGVVGLAQVESGQIAGVVTDNSGAVVPGATVIAKNLSTNAERTSVSDAKGAYVIPGLEPASYEVDVNSASFQSYKATVEVTVGSHITVDAKLSAGSATTVVEVIATGGVSVNTQTHELSQVINSQQIANLPSLTRNPYDFVNLSGNVSGGDNTGNSMSSGQSLTTRGVGVSINGQRESGTEILLDGVENVSIFSSLVGQDIPIDAVQEYSVITNNFSAEYGRASGGVVNLATKSGTNHFHGSVWEFNRLSAYTANTYANDAANQFAGSVIDPKGTYTRNQFGFVVGGPIWRDKLFFTGSTEWTRVRSSASETQEILDPSFISMLPSNTQNYFTTYGQGAHPASGVVVTAGQLSNSGLTINNINGVTPVAASQPIFDVVNFTAPFDAGGGFPQNTYTLVGRLDFNLNPKTNMFFRLARENQDEFPGSDTYSAYSQYDTGLLNQNQSYLFSVSHTFTDSLFDNFKASFTRFNSITSFDTSLTYTPNLMIVPPSDPVTNGLIQLPGLQNLGEPGAGGLPFGGPQNTIQLQDDVSWSKGRHTMRFGGVWTYIQLNVSYGAYAQAVEELGASLQDSFDNLVNAAGNPLGSGLVSFQARVDPQGKLPCYADIYGNVLTTPSCEVTPPLQPAVLGRSYRYNDWAGYGMDSFKLTPRFTLNYGLRYEHYGVQHNNNAALDSNFYLGSGSNISEQVRTGNVYIANQSPVGQFWEPRWGTVAPRIGFALDVMGDGKTSIRGGYGISYERNFGNVTYNASFNPPASAVLNSVCAPATPGCTTVVTSDDLGPLGVPGPPQGLPPTELRAPQSNINVAQTQFWSLALQRQLGPDTIVELSYSGARGVHLYDVENINLAGAAQYYLGDPLVSGDACAGTGFVNNTTQVPICLSRPNQQYSNINMRGSLGASAYNGFNIKLQSNNLYHSGVSIVANYTWAHSLDDISSTFSDSLQGGSGDVGSLGYTDFTNPGLDWGSSDFDIRNRFIISPIWSTPWFKNQHNLRGLLAGGWTTSGIYSIRGGIPFSIYDYSNVENFYTIPRLSPLTPISSFKVTGSPQSVGPNQFNGLTVPIPASSDPLDPRSGISDFGPYPSNMTSRNSFRGPGAWNFDLAASKRFAITERFGLEFRAEGFDIFNHHNFYTNTTNLLYDYSGSPFTPLTVSLLKGGLGSLATGGNHDERRFGQFALRFEF